MKKKQRSNWERYTETNTEELGSIKLPSNSTRNLSEEARSYLYLHHFDDDLIEKYGILFNSHMLVGLPPPPKEHGVWYFRDRYCNSPRLIFPYYNKEKLIFFEAKSFNKSSKIKCITIGSKLPLFKTCKKENVEEVVIVEDIMSAIRVGEHMPTIALRGTSLNDKQLIEIMKYTDKFIVWLDSDGPGKRAAKVIGSKLYWRGSVKNIETPKDPKCYSDVEIDKYLEEIER